MAEDTEINLARTSGPVPPPAGRLIVKRNGSSITRQIPKPVVLVDTREQMPFDFSRFPNWIAGEKRKALRVGDYSVEGMEEHPDARAQVADGL
jgi:hypothetical protein